MYSLELTEFHTEDRLMLPGILYTPRRKTKSVAILLHGNGSTSVFYSLPKMHILANHLTQKGISFFPFNNRGAHIFHKIRVIKGGKEEYVKVGTSHELIKDCIKDINAAIAYLTQRGYQEFYLIGFSTGANKICVYNYYKPKNKISKYVMVGGGDDTGVYYQIFGKEKFYKFLKMSKDKIQQGKGEDIVLPELLGGFIMSYQSLYDTFNPDGDYNTFPFYEVLNNVPLTKKKKLFREFTSIRKPTYVIYGEHDEYCHGKVSESVDLLKKQCTYLEDFQFTIIKGVDHSISKKIPELAGMIADWLVQV